MENNNKKVAKVAYASVKPSKELLGLFQKAEKLDAGGLGLARSEIYERAQKYLIENHDKIDFKNLSRAREKIKYEGELPSSFKVAIIDEELDSRVDSILREKYSITRVMTPFKLKVVLSIYVHYLEEGVKVQDCKEDNLKESNNLDFLKIKAISLIVELESNNEQLLSSIIENLEEKRV